MNLDGSRQRLVLPPGHDKKLSVIAALMSPDGTTLAYIRQDLVSPAVVTDKLWVLNLATGQRADLGYISTSAFTWTSSTAMLTAAADDRSLQLVSAATGRRTTYLTVSDPVLVHAYERARPGAGPPAYIGSDGAGGSGTSSRVAVWLAASRRGGTFRPAEVVVGDRTPLVTYAPPTPEVLGFSWGPDGLVLLQTGAGDNPGSWNTYVATLQSPRLSKPWPFGMDGATFNPAAHVIALQHIAGVMLVPPPRPGWPRSPEYLSFHPLSALQSGTPQPWIP